VEKHDIYSEEFLININFQIQHKECILLKKMRILYSIYHTGLLLGEAQLLAKLGHEVFVAASCDDVTNFISLPDYKSSYFSSRKTLIDIHNKSISKKPELYNRANEYNIDMIIVSLDYYTNIQNFENSFTGVVMVRFFGREQPYNYDFMYPSLNMAKNKYIIACAYNEVIEHEHVQNRSKLKLLSLPLKFSISSDTWIGRNGPEEKIMFVCSDIKNPYYWNIYCSFIKNFGDLPYSIFGQQYANIENIPNLVSNLTEDEYYGEMVKYKVMFYHSTEPRHLHFHPIEAIKIGMPVIYMKNSLLGKYAPENVSACLTVEEAKEKVKRVLNNDYELIDNIISQNKRILEYFSEEQYARQFSLIEEGLKS